MAAVSGPALGAEPPAKPPTSGATVSELVITATKMVSELTVTAKAKCLRPESGAGGRVQRPKVASVFPARGAVVRPGLLVVRITFDQPMACEGGLDAAPPLPNPCPRQDRQMLLSLDRRTVRTVCVVEPGTQYGFSLGQDPNAATFVGLGGLPAEMAKVAFSTSAGPRVSEVCEALGEDAETAAEMRSRGKACGEP